MEKQLKAVFLFILFLTILCVIFTDKVVFAQSAVSCWLTQIGTPTGEKPTLPPECTTQTTGAGTDDASGGGFKADATCPGSGSIICSTKKGGCHCTDGYIADLRSRGSEPTWCFPPPQSSDFGVDIENDAGDPIYIPKIYRSEDGKSHTLTCIGYCYDQQNCDLQGSYESNQIIQSVSCKDDVLGDAVWLHFHHSDKSMPTVGGKQYKSGDQIGISAPQGLPHVHLQMGVNGPCETRDLGVASCVEPYLYVQCG